MRQQAPVYGKPPTSSVLSTRALQAKLACPEWGIEARFDLAEDFAHLAERFLFCGVAISFVCSATVSVGQSMNFLGTQISTIKVWVVLSDDLSKACSSLPLAKALVNEDRRCALHQPCRCGVNITHLSRELQPHARALVFVLTLDPLLWQVASRGGNGVVRRTSG